MQICSARNKLKLVLIQLQIECDKYLARRQEPPTDAVCAQAILANSNLAKLLLLNKAQTARLIPIS